MQQMRNTTITIKFLRNSKKKFSFIKQNKLHSNTKIREQETVLGDYLFSKIRKMQEKY